jgi:divalent anion:Na+ symporter, DASS family
MQLKNIFLLLCFLIGICGWLISPPEGVTPQAWKLFTIFLSIILGLVTKPLPMGALVLIGLTATVATGVLSFPEAFKGFSNEVVWLVLSAFFIARGFVKTGLGNRIAYIFLSYIGRSALGMGYGLIATDFVLAPLIPSVTARAGGIIFPMVDSLSKALGSDPLKNTSKRIGAYLIQVSFQGTFIASAMFVTAMAGNPLIIKLASEAAPLIGWGDWALAAIVPGLLSLLALPLFLLKVFPPQLKHTPEMPLIAKEKLTEMGKMKPPEWIMLFTFLFLLTFWIFGKWFGMIDVVVGLMGLGFLLLTQVLTWKDILNETEAWDTLVWFSGILTFSSELNRLGLTQWISTHFVQMVQGFEWWYSFLFLVLIYFYIHYFFASIMAKAGAFYFTFLVAIISLGAPPLLSAFVLAFFTNLSAGLTHYGSGPSAIYFGAGYIDVLTWWRVGFLVSVMNIVIWLGSGFLWWKFLGIW